MVRRVSRRRGGLPRPDLNFTFISKVNPERTTDFSVFADPVIKVLKELGVDAMLLGRNDIIANDRKISGNAQRLYRTKFLQHGTLLFDVNLEDLAEALNVSADKIQSKGIKSIRSRVANIREFLKEDMSIDAFRELLQRRLSDDYRSMEIKLLRKPEANRGNAKNKFVLD